MSTHLIWADPPQVQMQLSEVPAPGDERFRRLRACPGRWSMWGPVSQPSVGFRLHEKYPDFEVTTRRRYDGRWDLYVRYVGEDT